MRILCDNNMPLAREAFSTLGDVTIMSGRHLKPADVRDIEILAIRSTTKVTSALLAGSRVRFVGTATIGTDHMDIPWLERQGIRWCYAPGCNANSVSEYLVAALLHLGRRHGFRLAGKTIGIIGVGNVGRKVAEKARALGLRALLNDPPRARNEGPAGFVEMEPLLRASDIVTLHVPLTAGGPDATRGMAGRAFFECMKQGAIFINAARGPVMISDDLLQALSAGKVSHAVLDTWEGEPDFRPDVLARAALATPHIAGHSYEGKVVGTLMVYREACRFLGVPAPWTPDALMPAARPARIEVDAGGREDEAVLEEIVRQVYDTTADDTRMRAIHMTDAAVRAAGFDELRRTYPERREFPAIAIRLTNGSDTLYAALRALGFRVSR